MGAISTNDKIIAMQTLVADVASRKNLTAQNISDLEALGGVHRLGYAETVRGQALPQRVSCLPVHM